jgi:hypothetical protein
MEVTGSSRTAVTIDALSWGVASAGSTKSSSVVVPRTPAAVSIPRCRSRAARYARRTAVALWFLGKILDKANNPASDRDSSSHHLKLSFSPARMMSSARLTVCLANDGLKLHLRSRGPPSFSSVSRPPSGQFPAGAPAKASWLWPAPPWRPRAWPKPLREDSCYHPSTPIILARECNNKTSRQPMLARVSVMLARDSTSSAEGQGQRISPTRGPAMETRTALLSTP